MRALLKFLLALSLGACGGADDSGEKNENAQFKPAKVYSLSTDLPACNEEIEGALVFIVETSEFQYCSTSTWTSVDLKGEDAKPAPPHPTLLEFPLTVFFYLHEYTVRGTVFESTNGAGCPFNATDKDPLHTKMTQGTGQWKPVTDGTRHASNLEIVIPAIFGPIPTDSPLRCFAARTDAGHKFIDIYGDNSVCTLSRYPGYCFRSCDEKFSCVSDVWFDEVNPSEAPEEP